MSKKRDISLDDLREMMIAALKHDGFSQSEIAAYVAAQEGHGWLRPETSVELRNLAAIHYAIPPASGFRP